MARINLTTTEQLVAFLSKLTAPTRADLTTMTIVRMNKKDVATKSIKNPYDEVYKVQTTTVELNSDYQGLVNNQRLMEQKNQTFEAGHLPWGEAHNNIIVEHNGELYIKTIEIERVSQPTYLHHGKQIAFSAFAQFVPENKGAPGQGLTDQVKVRTYKLSSVAALTIGDVVEYLAG